MNTAPWKKEILKPVVDASGGGAVKKEAGKVVRPPKEQSLPCPRCKSTNTKFCYYNNYSLTQPRYFCKGCRRYWTEGGSLRNIPVGGCSRKNKRSLSSLSTDPPGVGAKRPFVFPPVQNPNFMIHPPECTSQSLNFAFPTYQHNYRSMSDLVHMSKTSLETTALEVITGMASSGVEVEFGGESSNSFIQDFNSPTLNFSLEYGLGTRQISRSGVLGTSTHNILMSPSNNLKNQQVDHHHYQQQF